MYFFLIKKNILSKKIPEGSIFYLKPGKKYFLKNNYGHVLTLIYQKEIPFFLKFKRFFYINYMPFFIIKKVTKNVFYKPNFNLIWVYLRQIYDPEISLNIVDLGLIYEINYKKILTKKYKFFFKNNINIPVMWNGRYSSFFSKRKNFRFKFYPFH